jgi:hypothetical protein
MDKENQTPTRQLAKEITAALIDAGLIEKKREEDLLKKIVAGNVKSEDWALWVDTAVEVAGKESANGQ